MELNVENLNQSHHEHHDTSSLKGPGFMLKNSREHYGLTLEQVASCLNLTVPDIEDLENNHYQRFSALVFIRGYLRAYAKLLKLPPEDIIHSFEQLGISTKEQRTISETTYKPHREFTDQLVPWMIGGVILIILTIGFIWWHAEKTSSTAALTLPSNTDNSSKIHELTINPKSNQDLTLKGEPNPLTRVKNEMPANTAIQPVQQANNPLLSEKPIASPASTNNLNTASNSSSIMNNNHAPSVNYNNSDADSEDEAPKKTTMEKKTSKKNNPVRTPQDTVLDSPF